VLNVIERSIFRQDPNSQGEVFDLEAYRELLLLYAMAKDINAPASLADQVPGHLQPDADNEHRHLHGSDFGNTELEPLPAQTKETRQAQERHLMDMADLDQTLPSISSLNAADADEGLDVDLSFPAVQAQLPDVDIDAMIDLPDQYDPSKLTQVETKQPTDSSLLQIDHLLDFSLLNDGKADYQIKKSGSNTAS
jgi:hypothetical protein